jgi:hypothetical protein
MSNNRIIQRIGKKLRDQTSDIVQAGLPDPVRALLRQLASSDAAESDPSQNGQVSSQR